MIKNVGANGTDVGTKLCEPEVKIYNINLKM